MTIVDGGNASSTFGSAIDGGSAGTIFPAARPQAALLPTMDPVPRVELTFTETVTNTARATVFRIGTDRTYRVRGLVNVAAAGGFGGIDTEAPFNVPVTYRAEMFDSDGVSLGFTDSTTVVLEFTGTVIQQPIDPARAVSVTVAAGSAAELVRPFDGDLVRPIGRSVPVYVGRGRTGLQDFTFDAITDTIEQAAAMQSVFGGYGGDEQLPVVCIRSSLPLGFSAPLFAAVLKPTQVAIDAMHGGYASLWHLAGDEVAPPVEAIVRALLSYQDVEDAFASYADIETGYLTYLDVETDYDLAGSSS